MEDYKEALSRMRSFIQRWDGIEATDSELVLQELREKFPELKKSEDERIKKASIEFIKQNNSFTYCKGVSKDDCLAWLEKQGEQKPTGKVEPKFKVGDKIKLAEEPKYPAREIIAIKNDAYCFDKLEQLPFSNQDKWELVEQTPADKIKQKPAWSEEDERMLGKVISTIRYALSIPLDSEDDSCFAGSSTISWLKSLKERYTWKPSDEQIETLGQWLRDSRYKCYHIIDLLYQDLKKLKGE